MSENSDARATPDAWSAETRRTFRFWGIAELIYAALLVGAVAALLPWKSPGVNVALMAYGGLHGARRCAPTWAPAASA